MDFSGKEQQNSVESEVLGGFGLGPFFISFFSPSPTCRLPVLYIVSRRLFFLYAVTIAMGSADSSAGARREKGLGAGLGTGTKGSGSSLPGWMMWVFLFIVPPPVTLRGFFKNKHVEQGPDTSRASQLWTWATCCGTCCGMDGTGVGRDAPLRPASLALLDQRERDLRRYAVPGDSVTRKIRALCRVFQPTGEGPPPFFATGSVCSKSGYVSSPTPSSLVSRKKGAHMTSKQ